MIEFIIIIAILFLTVTSFVSLWRVVKGPTVADRIVAINVLSSKVVAIIVMIALVTKQESYVNVALVYAMIGFLGTIGVAKYLVKGKLE